MTNLKTMNRFTLVLIALIVPFVQFSQASVIEISPYDEISHSNIISWEPQIAAELINGTLKINEDFAGILNIKTPQETISYWVIPELSPTVRSNSYNLHDSLDLIIPRQSFQNKKGFLKVTKFLPGEFPISIKNQSSRIPAFCADLNGITLDSNLHLQWLGSEKINSKDWYFFKPSGEEIPPLELDLETSNLDSNTFLTPKENPICFAPMSLGFEHKRIKLNITPNPFSPVITQQTTITFKPGMSHDQAVNISLKIYDRFGEIKNLLDEKGANQTTQTITWDGTDNKGRSLNNGRYLLILKVNSVNSNEKYNESKPIFLFK